jgi:hypothetical protein
MSLLLIAAAAAAAEAPICTDRPTKANSVCTVPAGVIQLESSAVGWSRTEASGSMTKVLSAGSSVIKYGLSDRSDLQVGFTPLVRIESDGAARSGFGDVVVRYKHRMTGVDAKVQVALIPFVKLPAAKRGIGNRKVEGGLAVPVSLPLGGGVTATFGSELDVLADGDGEGRHVALVNLINLSGTIAPRLTLAGELWSNLNFDPSGTVKQASVDVAAAYAVSNNAQLDAGANFGLTRETADVEIYAGVSVRF